MLFAWTLVIINLVIYPVAVLTILILKQGPLQRPEVMARFGEIYKDQRLNSLTARLYLVIFLFRRVLICMLAFYGGNYPGIQVQVILYLNLFCFVYTGQVRPFATPEQNRTNLYYEFIIMCLTSQMVIFT